jgi:hypothetical protein
MGHRAKLGIGIATGLILVGLVVGLSLGGGSKSPAVNLQVRPADESGLSTTTVAPTTTVTTTDGATLTTDAPVVTEAPTTLAPAVTTTSTTPTTLPLCPFSTLYYTATYPCED